MADFVSDVCEFNTIAGTPPEYNARKLSLYIGLILEEVSEMIDSLGKNWELDACSLYLEKMSTEFKEGKFDLNVAHNDRVASLDAAIDIAVVALGAGIANGADVIGACDEVMASNLSKFPMKDGVRTVLKDENGKVKKPPEYRAPELEKYLIGEKGYASLSI